MWRVDTAALRPVPKNAHSASMTLEQMLELASAHAERVFNRDMCLDPTFHIVDGLERYTIMQTPWISRQEKAQTIALIRANIDAIKLFAFAAEAWMLDVPPNGDLIIEDIGAHRDAHEIIDVFACDRIHDFLSGHFLILRPERGRPRLSRFIMHNDVECVAGTFTEMFKSGTLH